MKHLDDIQLPPALVAPKRASGRSMTCYESLTIATLRAIESGGSLTASIVLDITRHRWQFAQIPGVQS